MSLGLVETFGSSPTASPPLIKPTSLHDASQVSDGVKKCAESWTVGRTSPRRKEQNKMLHSRPAWPGHDPPRGADGAAGRRTWSGMKTRFWVSALIKKTIICKQDELQLGRNADSVPVSACSYSARYSVTVRLSVRCRLLLPLINRWLQLRANHLCLSFIITLGVKNGVNELQVRRRKSKFILACQD